MNRQSIHQGSNGEAPIVSIGLPVYNGENFLEQAIQSVLAQTLTDFELIIFDNASIDLTESICRRYVELDKRIVYHRNDKNLGAAANYDLCFNHSKGEFFKWAAHDDMIEPDYLEKTVKALQDHPEAIKCVTGVRMIDESGNTLDRYRQDSLRGDQVRASKRFKSVIKCQHNCVEFFCLYRRKALVGSQLHGNFVSSDRVLIAEMALRGRTIRLDDHLFIHRTHDMQSIKAKPIERLAWWSPDGANKRRNQCYQWIILLNFYRAIHRSAPTLRDRFACYLHMMNWIFSSKRLKLLTGEICSVFIPSRNR